MRSDRIPKPHWAVVTTVGGTVLCIFPTRERARDYARATNTSIGGIRVATVWRVIPSGWPYIKSLTHDGKRRT